MTRSGILRNSWTLALIGLVLAAPCAWAEHFEIIVDGITGEFEAGHHPPALVRPGDQVTVEIIAANLVDYEYAVKEQNRVVLVESFPIVGVGTVFEAVGATPQAITPSAQDLRAQSTFGIDDLIQRYENLLIVLDPIEQRALTEIRTVNQTAASLHIRSSWGNGRKWPTAFEDIVDPTTGFRSVYEQIVKDLQMFKAKLDLLSRDVRTLLLNPPTNESESNRLSRLQEALQALEQRRTMIDSDLDTARTTTDRWRQVFSLYPEPVRSVTFPMDRVSARITLQVERTPISNAGLALASELADPKKVPTTILKSITFENRALHRFNFTLGLVGVDRKDDRAFGLVSTVNDDQTLTHTVAETDSTSFDPDLGAFLGIYLGKRVDPFDPARGFRPMLMLGTEVSSSPDTFFLGLGLDSPHGVVFGLGLTKYTGVDLADGWTEGLTVPSGMDGKPLVATPPVVKDDKIGFYALVGFRPAIFRAFLKLRKPS